MTGGMLTLRPYRPEDAETVLSWCADERAFYQWTAGVLGPWPLSAAAFNFVERLTPFIAEAAGRPAGFFTLRRPEPEKNELRFGFVILDPALRGRGLGKEMLRLGLDCAFGAAGAEAVTLGVFENNPRAYRCYAAAGFREVFRSPPETYAVLGEAWPCREMRRDRPDRG